MSVDWEEDVDEEGGRPRRNNQRSNATIYLKTTRRGMGDGGEARTRAREGAWEEDVDEDGEQRHGTWQPAIGDGRTSQLASAERCEPGAWVDWGDLNRC